ncbi:uncharacterized protein TRAVEDRAFT_46065 [Trametes versicolor FP-101664 SS1]|uniref:uncharacterized protein n=1 Tax=Trametes versicolor (strain FP-101664) TaxID=717944 RepID=UPI0004623388|nr:uncharacterized protein TRAVEDRAFT_46065 [Trametes versicolor FP-101664 SS1]EIW60825.1 hypothetical protein TRAVEDRAFT_46065 [Trametes versicolor FP-101664 SS1]
MPVNRPKVAPDAKGPAVKPTGTDTTVATKGKTRGVRNVGKLARLLNMPDQIFFMVTSHLSPLDMLNLSRSSKSMRAILSSKKLSKHAWVAARKNIVPALPDCPDFISEMAYAHVLFEHSCEACDAPRARHALYEIPMRLCKQCLEANVGTGTELMKRYKIPEHRVRLIALFCPLYPRSTPDDVPWTSVAPKLDDRFYEPDFAAIKKQAWALGKPHDLAGAWAYGNDRRQNVFIRMKFREAVMRWEDERASRNKALRSARAATIEAKLGELGVDKRDMPIHNAEWKSLVYQPRELSERSWETLRPELLGLIKELGTPRHKKLKEYHDAFIGMPSLPSWVQTREFPSMKALISVITDEEREVSKEEFAAVETDLRREVEEFQRKMRREMVQLLAEAGVLPSTAGRSTKGKERTRTSDDEACALLDTPAAFFVCNAIRGYRKVGTCCRVYSYAGLVEHWLHDHPCDPWEPSYVDVAWDEGQRESLARLLSALGLHEGTPVSAVEERVRSGRAMCSCGVDCTRGVGCKRPYLLLSKIVEHVLDPDVYTTHSTTPTITFKAFRAGKASRVAGEN